MIAQRVLARMYALHAATNPSTRLIAGLLVIAAAALAWFGTIHNGILMGDDLGLVDAYQHGEFASSLAQSLTQTSADKYRPILALVVGVVIGLFGNHFGLYQALNIVVETCSAVLVAAIVLRLTRGNELLALMCGLAFVVSRFAYYNVMQVFGLMEGLALLFMLLAVRDAADAFVLRRFERLTRMVLWYGLAVFTDERYIVLGLFIVVCGIAHPQGFTKLRTTATVVGGAIGVLVFYVAVKAVLHIPMVVGSGTHVVVVDPTLWSAFLRAGAANVLGFNVGPDYLSTKDVALAGPTGYGLGFLVALPSLGVFAAWAITAYRQRNFDDFRLGAIGASLFFPLLLSSAVTFRQEFRWLYAADAVFLIGVAAVAVRAQPHRLALGAAAVVFAANIAGAMWYRTYLDNLYLIGAMDVATGVRDVIGAGSTAPVYIIDNGDDNYPNWVFLGGRFFSIYGIAGRPVTFVHDASEIHGPADVFAIKGVTVVPVAATPPKPAPVVAFAKPLYSFTKAFEKGTLNSKRAVSTPNHRGAVVLSWPGPSGPVESLNVIDSFRYRYPPLRIARGTRLAFYVARPYPSGTPTRAFVTASEHGKSSVIFDELIPPASPTAILWTRREIDLSRFAGRSVALTFAADADRDQTAAWVAFGYPSLVMGKR